MDISKSIELRHLRYFVATCERGSFRKVAAGLGVAESTISRSIRDLEDRLGAALFHRHPGGVHQTFAGKRFFGRARHILDTLGEGAKDVTNVGRVEDGQISIGKLSSLASGFLPELLKTFTQNHTQVKVDVSDGSVENHITALHQFNLDVAFLPQGYQLIGCDSEYFWSERVFAVFPENHPLAQANEIYWPSILNQHFVVGLSSTSSEISRSLVRWALPLGAHPRITRQSSNCDDIFSLVAMGMGLSFTTETKTVGGFPGVVFRPIKDEFIDFSAVWPRGNENPALWRLLCLARGIYKNSIDLRS